MKKLLLFIALIISGLGLNAQQIGDYTIIDYDGYSLKYKVTSVEPAECEVSCSKKPKYVGVSIPPIVEINQKMYNVTSIGESAFYYSSLTSVEIPSGVTSIGSKVFYGCSSLTSVEIPSGVTSIDGTFYECSNLSSVTFGENSQLISIGSVAFCNCSSLTSIEIPSGVTSIGNGAFLGCSSLTSIEIPSGVTSIGFEAFEKCSLLTSIEIPNGVTSIGSYTFHGCSNLSSVTFGDNSQLTSIGFEAFQGCKSLTSIEIPSGVTSIDKYAFRECTSLTRVEIPSSVTSIGAMAFYDCSNLVLIKCYAERISSGNDLFSYGVVEIRVPGNRVDYYESLWGPNSYNNYNIRALNENSEIYCYGDYNLEYIITSVESAECEVLCSGIKSSGSIDVFIPSTVEINQKIYNVTSIDVYAFRECTSLTRVEIPSGVTSIGRSAFYGCSSLTSIEIPSSVTSIGEYAFYGCTSLTSIEIPSGVTSIGRSAFEGCTSLTSIEIPSSITSIDSGTFSGCSNLSSVTFVENSQLTSIGRSAFYGCSSLTSIEIPSSVTSIGGSAFEGCTSLTSIICYAENVPNIDYYPFSGCPASMIINVYANSIDLYKASPSWKKFTIEPIAYIVDYGDYSLKYIILSSSHKDCFVECGIKPSTNVSMIIPAKVTIEGEEYKVISISDSAFQGCTSLTSIEIPSSVNSIGASAFQGCTSLTSIEIPSSVTSIGNSAFEGCTSLTSIICYAENVPDIGTGVFYGCPASMIINVYVNSIDLYKASSYWNDFTIEPIIAYIVDYGDYSLKYAIKSASDKECEVLLGATSGSRLVISIPSTVEINQNTYDVTSVGDNAFRDCSSLYAIDVPSCITSIGDEAFSNSSLKLISFGENSQLTYIGKRAFQNSDLFKIKIPSGVISIEEYTFFHCSSLSSVTFCEKSQLRSIGYSAFQCDPRYANHLKSIEIPSSVTSIGEYAFSGCKSLTEIICYAENVPTTGMYAFVACSSVIYVPKNSFEMYKTSRPWSDYTIKSMPTHCEVVLVVNPSQAGTVIGAGSYDINDDVTIIATVNEGYTFVNWTENGKVVSEEAEYKFTTTIYEENREFVANFEPMDYEVTASVNNENFGTVTGSGNYKHGDNVKLTAVSNAGYAFVNWTENGEVVSEEAEYSFIIKSDRNLVANFIEAYDVEVSLNPENAGSVTGTGIYKQGDNVTLIASQKEGYKFINWTENGEVVSEEAEYSFTITSDRDLVANFELLTYEVTASVNNENFGTVTGSGNYKHGDNVKLTAVSKAGYAFVNWTENGEVVSEEAEYSFTITTDRDLVANFVSTESISEMSSSMNIYPNPVNDKLYIETEVEVEKLVVYDIYGRHQVAEIPSCQGYLTIDFSNLTSGVYFVKIVTDNGNVVKRIVKN